MVFALVPACAAEGQGGDVGSGIVSASESEAGDGEAGGEAGGESSAENGGTSAGDGGSGSADSASGGASSGGEADESGSADSGPAEDSTGGAFDLDELDDDFEGGALAGWDTHNPGASSVALASGQLVLEPGASTVWLDASTSVLVWKEVPGNFIASASVTARRADDPTAVPLSGYRFGGLMARNPSEATGQNYVFIVLGTDTDPSVETKTTVDSWSTYEGPSWPSAAGDVRICRVGSTFRMLVRERGGEWQVTNQFERGDLPDALQVGPIAYNNNPDPDLRVTFDFVDFEAIDTLDECAL
jgi:hypothetical protein